MRFNRIVLIVPVLLVVCLAVLVMRHVSTNRSLRSAETYQIDAEAGTCVATKLQSVQHGDILAFGKRSASADGRVTTILPAPPNHLGERFPDFMVVNTIINKDKVNPDSGLYLTSSILGGDRLLTFRDLCALASTGHVEAFNRGSDMYLKYIVRWVQQEPLQYVSYADQLAQTRRDR